MKDYFDLASKNSEIREQIDIIKPNALFEICRDPGFLSAHMLATKITQSIPPYLRESAQLNKFLEFCDSATLKAIRETAIATSKLINPNVLGLVQSIPHSPMAEFIKSNSIASSSFIHSETVKSISPGIVKTTLAQRNVGSVADELLSEKMKLSFSETNQPDISNTCVPDTITIPIGNHHVKIRTDLFLSIVVVIIELTMNLLLSSTPQSASHPDETQIECQQTQEEILQWQTHAILELLHDKDTSVSSQAESLQELKEFFESQNSEIQLLKESDTIQNSEIQELKSSQNSDELSPDNKNVSANTVLEK